MSKITDALHRAEQDRELKKHSMVSAPAQLNGTVNSPTRPQEELTWSPQVLRRRPEPVPVAVASVQESSGHFNGSNRGPDGHGQPTGNTPGSPAQANGPMHGTPAVNPNAPESVDQAIELVKRQLETFEQQAARHTAEQLRLKAELAASEQLQTKIAQEQSALRQQLEAGAKTAASIESTKAAWVRQLESLRECQVLSHAVRRAMQELKANAAMVAHADESQRKAAEELAQYQQRGHALQQQVDQLQFRLGQALAFTGTTDPVLADVERMRNR